MARLLVILTLILMPFAAVADTLDYSRMSRTPARELFRQANIYSERHQEDTAMAYYLYTIGACGREGDDESGRLCAEAYKELGKCYYNQGYYSKAFDAFASALKIAEANGYDALLPHIYNNIGSIYCTWNDLETGIHYFRRGVASLGDDTAQQVYVKLLINTIGAECRLGNVDGAWSAYKLLMRHAGDDPVTEYYCLINRGLILITEGKVDEAKPHVARAAKFAEDNGLDPLYLSYACSTMGDIIAPSHPDSAIFYYNKAISQDIPPFMRRTLLKSMANIYRSSDPKLAESCEHSYLMLSDSLFDDNEINRTKGAQFIYETEKNYRDMERLNAEKTAQAARIRSQRRTIFAAVVIIAIFAVLIFMVVRRSIKLRDAYRNLFNNSKEVIAAEMRSRGVQRALEQEIATLRARIEQSEATSGPEPATDEAEELISPKLQSSDRLTDRQKHDIEAAVSAVVERRREIFDCDFSIEMLADLTGYNSKYISKVIRESSGCNFRAWINAIRIREAQIRLLDTETYGNFTISAIAQSVGYRSHANFILLFKKDTGLSPSAYQKMARQDSVLSER